MQRLDSYKKTILFFACLINVAMLTALFAYVWYRQYSGMMFVVSFYRRGNYAMLALYAVLLFFFCTTYGGLKIGQQRRIEVLLSQYLSIFLANTVMYIVISLLAFRMVTVWYLAEVMLAQMLVSSIWNMLVIRIYNRIFQPWKLLLIYGERPAADLVCKVETRRDKYAIYDAIHIDEGLETIGERIKEFQAVIIGDISAVKRNDILKYCYANHIRAYVIPKISDVILMGADRVHVFDTPFLLLRGYTLSFEQRFAKRAMDLILSAVLLVVLFPLMLLIALVIRLFDGGPVLYSQVRCTQNERTFSIYKFRSMIVDAEAESGPQLAYQNDERITRVGRFLRATRLDELPQLFNILRGEMSFVGPRPERPELIREYCRTMPEFPFRNRVKAGLTGYAQVYGKYNTTPYDKLKLDLFYIANYSLWTDIKLVLMTIKTIFKKESTEGVDSLQEAGGENQTEDSGKRVEEVVKNFVNLNKK